MYVETSLADWKRLARIGHAAASDDDGRPIITGLHIEVETGPGRVTAVATDSHCLAVTSIEPYDSDGEAWVGTIPARQAFLVEKDVRSLNRFRPKKDYPDELIRLAVEFADEYVDVTIVDHSRLFEVETITRRIELIDGDFPVWRAFMEQTGDPSDTVTLNSETVDKILKTTASQYVEYSLHGSYPVRLRSEADAEWSALLMPARATGEA